MPRSRRYFLPCAVTAAYLAVITAAALYMSTQDRIRVDTLRLAIVIAIVAAATAATSWIWRRGDRGA